jgi:hypothetical protein
MQRRTASESEIPSRRDHFLSRRYCSSGSCICVRTMMSQDIHHFRISYKQKGPGLIKLKNILFPFVFNRLQKSIQSKSAGCNQLHRSDSAVLLAAVRQALLTFCNRSLLCDSRAIAAWRSSRSLDMQGRREQERSVDELWPGDFCFSKARR